MRSTIGTVVRKEVLEADHTKIIIWVALIPPLVMLYSNYISKVKQGGDKQTTKPVQVARPVVSKEASTVSAIKWNWNYMFSSGFCLALRLRRVVP